MDEAAKDGRSTTANTQSKASLMMTRSLSFPELGRSAEQLLTGIQSVEESISPFLNGASTTAGSMESRTTLQAEQEPISAPLQERIVRVRKRYSDFVALRAQLVDMLKAQSRLASRANGGRGLFSLPSSGRNSVVISTSSTPVTSRSPRYSEDHGSNVGNDDDEDEDEDRESNWHSRTSSGAFGASTGSSPTLVLCSSILRGMPKLPPKKVMGKFRPAFVEKRRRELEYFLEWIVAHPVIGDCPVVVQWFLGQP
ncbi:hypothetical protein BC939DRAFT_479181 [Gamsiella multidivaricata]|uniref:uncharacterized protein n=1 Tax=Gamsiella multidivaricata TaxID=101098 RepID=UPI0022212A21|nr:uncharacterized protein BC939DRAFT_479181 [Gamsiella multidivaricata]KAI7820032.1 hypothetical protein BC939DRAFT_479181 [Gamsiella multidivaricata]